MEVDYYKLPLIPKNIEENIHYYIGIRFRNAITSIVNIREEGDHSGAVSRAATSVKMWSTGNDTQKRSVKLSRTHQNTKQLTNKLFINYYLHTSFIHTYKFFIYTLRTGYAVGQIVKDENMMWSRVKAIF